MAPRRARYNRDHLIAIANTPNLGPLEHPRTLYAMQHIYVYRMLVTHEWNRSLAAYALGITVSSLKGYIRRFRAVGIRVPESPESVNARRARRGTA